MADGSVIIDAQTAVPEPSPAKPAKKGKARAPKIMREMSQTPFPYVDQDAAISVARALLDAGGVALTRDQLAGAMGQTPGSGNFAWKAMAARLFGLIEQKDGKNQLTDLGFAIVDEGRQKKARADAFLAVPLYRRVYDEFKGKQLPPRPVGLETLFVRFGVAPKQKDKARHAFERSAKQAGFFEHGTDRLVEPIIGGAAPASPIERRPSDPSPQARAITGQSRKSYHPFIEGLLLALPEPHDIWPVTERTKWLRAAQDIFELIYKSSSEGNEPTIGSAAQDLVTTKPHGPQPVRG